MNTSELQEGMRVELSGRRPQRGKVTQVFATMATIEWDSGRVDSIGFSNALWATIRPVSDMGDNWRYYEEETSTTIRDEPVEESPESRIDAFARDYGRAKWQQGYDAGLAVAQQIANWLTLQPDTKRQRYVREMAERLIARSKETPPPQ